VRLVSFVEAEEDRIGEPIRCFDRYSGETLFGDKTDRHCDVSHDVSRSLSRSL